MCEPSRSPLSSYAGGCEIGNDSQKSNPRGLRPLPESGATHRCSRESCHPPASWCVDVGGMAML
jgi:hypothetical protein